jgi:hypothetical protein
MPIVVQSREFLNLIVCRCAKGGRFVTRGLNKKPHPQITDGAFRASFLCLPPLLLIFRLPQRRHAALRTINGGICWGLTLLIFRRTQLLLLGYHLIL